MNEFSTTSLNEASPTYQADAIGGLDFDLPDWSGQLHRTSRVPLDQWLAYCRSNLPRLRQSPRFSERRSQHGVGAEFSL